jgi:hypothetical protein
MSEERGKEKDSISFVSWLWWGLGGGVVIYLLAFAFFVSYPGVARAASTIGLTNARLGGLTIP